MHDDSDDENMLGPPKLSNFGSALLQDKVNELNSSRSLDQTERYRRHQNFSNASHGLTIGLVPRQPSSNNTNSTLGVAFTTMNSEDASQSTLFATSRQNQPSMTTLNSTNHEQDSLSGLKEEESLQKVKNMQHTFKEELSIRHSKRRSRRFISPRLSILGPAKRAYSPTDGGNSGTSVNESSMHLEGNTSNSSGISTTFNSTCNDGNVFYDPYVSMPTNNSSGNLTPNNILRSYENVDFGDLNPYQYLKKHNLPTTELPNISKIYFEKQKGENRRTALRKNSASKEVFLNRMASNSSLGLTGLKNTSAVKIDNSFGVRQPRRKPSDSSLSGTGKTPSSPIVAKQHDSEIFKKKENVELNKGYERSYKHNTKAVDYLEGREALANIDINSKSYEPQSKKAKLSLSMFKERQKGSNDISNEIVRHRSPQNLSFNHRTAPSPPAKKRVEIVEPHKNAETVPLKPPAPSGEYAKRKPSIKVNGTEYEKMELLGRGGTSKVYKVKSIANNKIYALKRVSFDEFDDNSIEGFKGEIELLKKLEAKPRVVKLIDHEMEHGVLYVVMECGDHDLSQILAQRSGMPLDIEFVRYHAQEMLKCVKVVHDADIVHSDLKPANFVFVRGILKIIDFGIANAVPDHTVNIYRETQIGTPNYMAPEALVAMNYSQEQSGEQNRWKVGKPSDIWSCGCIIYQMIYGRPPYGGFQGQNRLLAIMNPEVKIVFPDKTPGGDIVPRTALDTMKACLMRNPDRRWTVDEVLNGPFIRPVTVTHFFIRDLIKNAVKYGADQKRVSDEKVEELAEDVWHRLADFKL